MIGRWQLMLPFQLGLDRGPRPHLVALGAHPDDIEIGCGGTLLQLAETFPGLTARVRHRDRVPAPASRRRGTRAELFLPGCEVTVTSAGLPDGRLPTHWEAVKELLEATIRNGRPTDLVLAPSRTDAHQDHRAIAELATTVWRDHLVLHYEIPKWDGDVGRPWLYVGLTDEQLREKVDPAAQGVPVPGRARLVRRRGVRRAGPAAGNGVPVPVRRSLHDEQGGTDMVSFACRGCGSGDTVLVVDLGAHPAADLFPPIGAPEPDPRWPLELWLCKVCTLVQLGPVEPLLEEPPLAVESATSLAHAESSVKELLRDHPEFAGRVVHEFASHHGGSWLGHLGAAGCRTTSGKERADLVIDVHGIAHEPAVGEMFEIRADRLAPDGLLVLEFHHLLPLLRGNQFDTIRHGHWSYLSLGAVGRLAERYGLALESVRQVDLFGGSLQVMLRHAAATPGPDRLGHRPAGRGEGRRARRPDRSVGAAAAHGDDRRRFARRPDPVRRGGPHRARIRRTVEGAGAARRQRRRPGPAAVHRRRRTGQTRPADPRRGRSDPAGRRPACRPAGRRPDPHLGHRRRGHLAARGRRRLGCDLRRPAPRTTRPEALMTTATGHDRCARRVAVLQRLSWGLADQAVSSLVSFAVGVYVAQSLHPDEFGAFSLAWVTYGVALNINRGLGADPLAVRFSGVTSVAVVGGGGPVDRDRDRGRPARRAHLHRCRYSPSAARWVRRS